MVWYHFTGYNFYCVTIRLWQHVTRAINNKDQTEATNEKFVLEEAQRKSARERKAKCEEWIPALFEQDPVTGEWHYRYAEWVKKLLEPNLDLYKANVTRMKKDPMNSQPAKVAENGGATWC